MSVDLYVLCTQELPGRAAWAAAMSEQHFPLVMDPQFDPADDEGFWPAKLAGREAGFEFYPLLRAEWERLPNLAQPSRFTAGVQFSSGSDPIGFVSSIFAAVAISRACAGVVYDPQGSKAYNASELHLLIAQAKVFGIPVTEP